MKKIYLLISILSFSILTINSQSLNKANHLFEKKAYKNAAELYLKEDTNTMEVQQKLGDCYYFNSNMIEASKWYKKLITKLPSSLNPKYLFRYAQALKGIQKFKEGDLWLNKYHETKSHSITNGSTKPFFDTLNQNIDRPFIVHKISSNSIKSDFGTSFYQNKIVFSSTRGNGNIYDWNKQPYLDLYQGTIDENGDINDVQLFSKNINTKFHESNATFTKDGKTMYFTRSNYLNGKKGKDKNNVNHLKIYKAELINNKWKNIHELPFNSNNYSVEHPALSPDGKKLYFASDMPESIGSFDLFFVSINEDGSYGIPQNLGNTINTEEREQFPFISSTNSLYFSSNGHFGLGGLDIFSSTISNGSFSNPLNLSNVINSSLDDFAFIINEENETGYFSSNRINGTGDDDIYRFTKVKKHYVNGVIKNKKTEDLLPGSTATLFDNNGKVMTKIDVKNEAKYSFEIKPNTNYKLLGTKELFNPSEISFSTNENGDINKDILLYLESYKDSEEKIVELEGKTQIKINPIYFNFNKWNVRESAKIELNNIVKLMKKYPNMIIEIGAHTDCRGSDTYNLFLSHKRAKSVKEYIIEQGVQTNNIKSIGYGEIQPLNNCFNETVCKEKEYAINRRCEFIIIQ